jgi:hypothetical protein
MYKKIKVPDFRYLTDDERKEIWQFDTRIGPLPTGYIYENWYHQNDPHSLPNLISVAQIGGTDWWPKVETEFEALDDMGPIAKWNETHWPTFTQDWTDLATMCLKKAPTEAIADLLSIFFKEHGEACYLILIHKLKPDFLQYKIANPKKTIDTLQEQHMDDILFESGFYNRERWGKHVEDWLTNGLHIRYQAARQSLNPSTPLAPPSNSSGGSDQGSADTSPTP